MTTPARTTLLAEIGDKIMSVAQWGLLNDLPEGEVYYARDRGEERSLVALFRYGAVEKTDRGGWFLTTRGQDIIDAVEREGL